jgi:cytochrome c
MSVNEPGRAADLSNGAKVFANTCVVCHGKDGLGQRAATGAGYQFPPMRANLEKDFPVKMQKPVDTPYGPYVDEFPAEQHKLGPFEPIRTKLRELAAGRK